MTTVYFVRHAEADNSDQNDLLRPLTQKGLDDRALVSGFLKDKNIGAVFSSPYKRALDTISVFARSVNLPIQTVKDFREGKLTDAWVEDFEDISKKQWSDFSYKLPDGECLAEIQKRNIDALKAVLADNKGKTIAIGTHGTALATIINYYDRVFGFEDFMEMVNVKPWIVKMDFDADGCVGMRKFNLFQLDKEPDREHSEIRPTALGELKAYRFVVVFARYQDKWLYCRAKERDSFETAGGHIELGETPIDAAKRELYEETGAVRFEIEPAFDYCVRNPDEYSNGQVFFARIHELGAMPDFEMSEVMLFDAIPGKMRFPRILPVLYARLQIWLNRQSSKNEVWDVYNSDRKLTGRTHRRADPLPAGDYHLAVYVWLQNSRGEVLISKRAPNKGYPNMWECTGGSALTGEESVTASIREVKEELGLDVKPENGGCVITGTLDDCIFDVWLFRQDFDVNDIILKENETIGAKYASFDEIRRMMADGEFVAADYNIEDMFKIADEWRENEGIRR